MSGAFGALLLLLVLWFPRLVDLVLPLPMATVVAFCAYLVAAKMDTHRRQRGQNAAPLLVVIGLLALTAILLQRLQAATSVTPYFFFLTILPGGILGARILADSDLLLATAKLNLLVGSLAIVPLASFEGLTGKPVFAPSLMVEDGHFRATVGQYHPIVLGVLLSLTIATVIFIRNRVLRGLVTAWLFMGIAFTYSQGPMAAAVAAIGLAWVVGLRKLVSRFAGVLTLAIMVPILLASALVDPAYVAGDTVLEYSNNYRVVLFAQIPDLLNNALLGFGLGDAPTGLFLAYSDLMGYIDLARTFDSELLLWVMRFGVIGLVAYLLMMRQCFRRVGSESWIMPGLLVLLMANGLTVALHSWINLGLLFAILIGQESLVLRSGWRQSKQRRNTDYRSRQGQDAPRMHQAKRRTRVPTPEQFFVGTLQPRHEGAKSECHFHMATFSSNVAGARHWAALLPNEIP